MEQNSVSQADETSAVQDNSGEAQIRQGWHEPQPKTLPQPTHWPFVLAVGTVLLLWGVVTSLVISGVGILVVIAALVGWIGDLRREPRS